MAEPIYLAAVEGGGTTFLASIARIIPNDECKQNITPSRFSIGEISLEIIETATFPPSSTNESWTPQQILSALIDFFATNRPSSGYASLGIATFGPIGVSPASPHYGCVLNGCPKKEWRGVDLLTPLQKACGVEKSKVGFDTDVNAPALAEFRHRCYNWQSKQGVKKGRPTSLAYITVGTGVGVGLIINSSPVHGLLHPEGGHCPTHTLPNDDFHGYSWGTEKSPFGGVGTVEGVTSTVALTERLMAMEKKKQQSDEHGDANSASNRDRLAMLSDDHPIWDHASNAIANLCVTILLLTSCETIVLGGGVMNRSILYKRIRSGVLKLLNGYLDVEELTTEEGIGDVICGSSWDLGSGLVGAFALALDCLEQRGETVKEQKLPEKRQGLFGSGVMVGIGLSLGCLLMSRIIKQS